MSQIFVPRKWDPFTAINAIVTREDDEYMVYYSFVQATWSDDVDAYPYWCNRTGFGDALSVAKAYADRLVACEDDEIKQELSSDYRTQCGNYQGCWSAPIVYSTTRKHPGLGEPWTR